MLALKLFQDTDKPNFLLIIVVEEIKSFEQLFLVQLLVLMAIYVGTIVFVLVSISRFTAPTTCMTAGSCANFFSNATSLLFDAVCNSTRDYGNTGCGVFKRGIQNFKDIRLKINFSQKVI